MDSGAAILNFGDEFGPNGVAKAMTNNGPNLCDNVKPNVVTPYVKHTPGSDAIEVVNPGPGFTANTQ